MTMIEVTKVGRAVVIRPTCRRLDAASAVDFRAEAGAAVDGSPLVVVHLGGVEFIDSSGLGSLVSLIKRLPPGGTIRLAEVPESVRTLLRMTRLDKVLPHFPTVETAAT